MTAFELNSKPALTVAISEPRSGAWVADVQADSGDDIGPSATLRMGSTAATFTGTVVRGGVEHGRYVARIVGGKGGLSKDIPARYYSSVPARTVLDGIMSDSGELLDPEIAPSLLDHALPRWTRLEGPAQLALDDLAAELGVTWRVTRAGKVWLGTERWGALSMPHAEMARGPAAGTLSVAPAEIPLVRPGVTFLGKRVSYVETTLSGGKLRQTIWVDESSASDRIMQSLTALVRKIIGRRVDYMALYPSTVVKQANDGSLEVLPDDQLIRGLGLTRVPIHHGFPGSGARVPKGARVLIGFRAGDPKRPYAALWEAGGPVTDVTLVNGSLPAARQGDMVSVPVSASVVELIAANLLCAAPGSPPTLNPAAKSLALDGKPLPAPPDGTLTWYGIVSSGNPQLKA